MNYLSVTCWVYTVYVCGGSFGLAVSKRAKPASSFEDVCKCVKSWDNGRVWLGIYHYIPSETRPLNNEITAVWLGIYHYIPSETRPLSNGITAAFGSV